MKKNPILLFALLTMTAPLAFTEGTNPPGDLPAFFTGVLPCADCEGIRYRLNLFSDGVFFLETTYLGRGEDPFFDMGKWIESEGGRDLFLAGGAKTPERFRAAGEGVLRKLDLEGEEIESDLNYDLTRAAAFETIEPRLVMTGMYGYMADAGLFRECLTGKRWPVAPLEENLALERAYLEFRQEAGEEILASVEGRIETRPDMEGSDRMMIVVERFIELRPGETCDDPRVDEPLENTYWKLIRLGGDPVFAAENQREPHLILHPNEKRLDGSGGCNRLMGSYEAAADSIRFGPLAGTRIACPEGMETERAFLEALEKARSRRIAGKHLEIFDEEGRRLARFEAVYLR